MLVNHRDAKLHRVVRRLDGGFLSSHVNLARLGLVQPVEDARQCGLAGPVLAQKRMDLALPQLEVHIAVSNHFPEPDGNSLHLHDGLAGTYGRKTRFLRLVTILLTIRADATLIRFLPLQTEYVSYGCNNKKVSKRILYFGTFHENFCHIS